MPNSFYAGRLQNSQRDLPTASFTANTTLSYNDGVAFVNANAGAVTITLPAAANYKGKYYSIKKTDASANVVTITCSGSDTIDGFASQYLFMPYEHLCVMSDGTVWQVVNDTLKTNNPRMLCRTLVSLTAAANTNLILVPTGRTLKVSDVWLEGQTAQSGGTSSKLLIGTSGNSYNELLNGSTGHTFVAATGSTLISVGQRMRPTDLYPPASMSVVQTGSFAAGSQIAANVSGTVLTAGAVYVELYGFLI